MTSKSSLIIADDCILEKVDIDGHSEINNTNGQAVVLENKQKNYKKVVDITPEEKEPYLIIRGYNIL